MDGATPDLELPSKPCHCPAVVTRFPSHWE